MTPETLRELITATLDASGQFGPHQVALAADHLTDALGEEILALVRTAEREQTRIKACEHLAKGEPGWAAFRNEDPATQAVAQLREDYERCLPFVEHGHGPCTCTYGSRGERTPTHACPVDALLGSPQ